MKMSRTPVFLLLLAVFLVFAAPRVRAQEEGSFDYFYDNLKPYGEWIQVEGYGLCWRPTDVDEDWAPYTDGYWAYTDAGWTWVSYEDFGDIVYHYGRWARVEGEGWCWVPDNDWGPAWVSWRNNDEYVGWAPLPPDARFDPGVGISVWVDDTYDIGPDYYRFCRVRDFGAPVIREVCFPRSRNLVFFRETINITNISFHSGFAFCGGPRYDFFSTRVLRPIPTLRLVRETNITNVNINLGGGRRRGFASIQRGNALLMPAPRIRAVADRTAPVANIHPARVLAADRVSHGWSGVKQQEHDEIRQVIKQQTQGATPQTAHARPVAPTELKPLPVKVIAEGPGVAATNRTPGKGTVNPVGTQRPVVTTGEGPKKGMTGDHRVVTPQTPGVIARPGGEEIDPRGPQNPSLVGKGKTVAPNTSAPPATTEHGKPLKRFDEETRPSGVAPVQPTQPVQRFQPAQPAQPVQRVQPTQPIESTRPTQQVPVAPPSGGGFKRGAVNTPTRPSTVDVPEVSRAPKPDYEQIQRQQAAAKQQQQQANIAAQERSAAAAEAKQRAAAAAESRNRAAAAEDARDRAQAAQRQAAAMAAARERAVQAQPPSVPARPGAPAQDPRAAAKGKDKDKDDDKKR
ncbi:MAG TPA: DUF6600 domain-containing protein [Chthoniobacteraceae bacterium]|jgi:hypothetical protein|nr:DUF6600 domain-containing protein [Chthoniobacteraceae bacterium]